MKVLKQILRAFGFFAIYLAGQFTAFMIVSVACGLIAGFQVGLSGSTDAAKAAELQMSYYSDSMGIAMILSVFLALGTYLIIFAARKVNPFKQVDLKKISTPDFLFTIAGAFGIMFFVNMVLNVIPFPESAVEEFVREIEEMCDIPLWQAIVGTSVLIPILEEVVFRGLIYGRLRRAMPAVVAAVITSAVFGLMHGYWIWAIWAFFVGMIINYARIRTGSILPGIIIHMAINLFSTLANYTPMFNNLDDTGVIVLLIIGGVFLIIFFVGLGIVTKKEKAAGLIVEPRLEDEDIKKEKNVSTVIV